MKKLLGIGFPVSGIGFRVSCFAPRVSGFGCRVSVLAGMLMLCGSGSGIAQQLKYKFRKGQVIQYLYKAESINEDKRKTEQYIYEFKVDSISAKGAWLTMTPRQNEISTITGSTAKSPKYYYTSVLDANKDLARSVWNLDMNREIRFMISEEGELSQLNGFYGFANEVAESARDNKSIAAKAEINYNWLNFRYSEEYYRILIGQFFPARRYEILVDKKKIVDGLPARYRILQGPKDIKMDYAKQSLIFHHYWDKHSDSITGKIQFSKSIIFFQNKIKWDDTSLPDFSPINLGKGEAHWNREKAIFDTISFQSVNIPQLLNTWVHGLITLAKDYRKENVEYSQTYIELLKESDQNRTVLNFKTRNSETMQMDLIAPGKQINSFKSTSTFPIANKDTSHSGISVPMEQDGFFKIYIHRIEERPYDFILNPNKVWFYAQPGDTMTIDLNLNLNLPVDVKFLGSHARENQYLQKFFQFTNGQNGIPDDSILQRIRNDRKLLSANHSDLDPKFIERLDFELKYLEKEYELRNLIENSHNQTHSHFKDTLQYYRQFLGQLKYPESSAYQEYIFAYLDACQWNTGILDRYNPEYVYKSAEVFLQGWDRYWCLASLVKEELKTLEGLGEEGHYSSFMNEYGESPFGFELKAIYKSKRIIDDPNLLTKLGITGFSGYPVIVSFDYEKTKDFYQKLIDHLKQLGPSDFRIVQFIPQEDYQKGIDALSVYSDPSGKRIAGTGSEIQPRILGHNLDIIREDFNSGLLLFDRDGRFVTYLPYDSYDEIMIENILSWPQLIPTLTPSKTVKLNVFWYSLGGVIGLALILLLVIRIRLKRKEKQLVLKRKMTQLEVDAVRSRMNPHFLFNALSSIQNLVNKNQIEQANLFLSKFGDLVRTILSQSSKPAIGLNEEIDMIRNYLQLEQLRFPFTFNIQTDPTLDQFAIEVPPLLIQPHVENAVMHGISGSGSDGRIEISFTNEGNHLICKVQDNGPGYHPETKTGNGGLGQGWKLTRQRIQLMKEQYGDDVSVEIQNNEDSSGATVIFILPIQNTSL
ncbi:MAG: histidine kinase [Bacteroidales bacterium]|nr:histidine kinase [Bacteroidales bacterium]